MVTGMFRKVPEMTSESRSNDAAISGCITLGPITAAGVYHRRWALSRCWHLSVIGRGRCGAVLPLVTKTCRGRPVPALVMFSHHRRMLTGKVLSPDPRPVQLSHQTYPGEKVGLVLSQTPRAGTKRLTTKRPRRRFHLSLNVSRNAFVA